MAGITTSRSYCGLSIVTRLSSDWVQTADGAWIKARVPQTRGLSRQHNHFLKSIFKGAATTVITQNKKDPIYARYERLLDGGTKPTLAKLSLARMIAAIVLRMWKVYYLWFPLELYLLIGFPECVLLVRESRNTSESF